MAVGQEYQGFGVAAIFRDLDASVSADGAVSRLEAAGVPAIRMPQHILGATRGPIGVSVYEPIRVLVPIERVEEAIETLNQEDQ